LDVQQLYILAFILFEGENTKTDQRLLLRGDVTRLLKAVYGSTDNQISQWVADLCSKGFLDAVTLNSSQNSTVFAGKKGRKALILNKNGVAKASSYIKELMKLRDNIARKQNFLVAPGMKSCGPFGDGILLFMSLVSRSAETPALMETAPPIEENKGPRGVIDKSNVGSSLAQNKNGASESAKNRTRHA